jgi:hypothetical protein
MIDDFLKPLEQPIINPAIKNTSLDKITKDFPILAKPARRRVDILVYSANKNGGVNTLLNLANVQQQFTSVVIKRNQVLALRLLP